VVVPNLLSGEQLADLNREAWEQLSSRAAPLELEADIHYPGAPESRSATGGDTVRRLLNVYDRSPVFAQCATAEVLRDWMESYFEEATLMSRAHHNCLMTKHPRYGSLTGWHRDIRYWSFQRDDLVSVWIALGEETVTNGALWVVPGSHRAHLAVDQFDQAKFFRVDREDNAKIVGTAVSPRLRPGDALFFHCKTLHSAGQNFTAAIKFSLVFTYHGVGNTPVAGTRSARNPEVPLA
jgi:phytanoyl-CoA hydroxylase